MSWPGWEFERIPVDQYWVNGFRYTNAGDAIAEAKRGLAQ